MFVATRHILETITRDPDTERVRSIKPDEKVESMWDTLAESSTNFALSSNLGTEVAQGFEASYTYTEADSLEDAILFPKEEDGSATNNVFQHDRNAMEIFESGALDIRQFANDPDTDEDMFDSDLDDEEELSDGQLEALGDDDGDSDWGTEPSDDDDGTEWVLEEENKDMNNAVDILANSFNQFIIRQPDYFLSVLRDPKQAKHIPESVRKQPAILMQVARSALRRQKTYDSSFASIEADFYRHIDRQKSKGTLVPNFHSNFTSFNIHHRSVQRELP